MSKRTPRDDDDAAEQELYGLLEELDRLEDLLEEMGELGVSSVADVERRIAELNAQVDALAPESS